MTRSMYSSGVSPAALAAFMSSVLATVFARVARPSGECPLLSKSDQIVAVPRLSALCQQRTHAPQQKHLYSITSSAVASTDGGTVRPSAFAVIIPYVPPLDARGAIVPRDNILT